MDTYSLIGLPEGLAVAFVLICLSQALAPWLGGLEAGPLKIPDLRDKPGRALRVLAPAALVVSMLGFLPFWNGPSDIIPQTGTPGPEDTNTPSTKMMTFVGCVGDNCQAKYSGSEFTRSSIWHTANNTGPDQAFAEEICARYGDTLVSAIGIRIQSSSGRLTGYGLTEIRCTIPDE